MYSRSLSRYAFAKLRSNAQQKVLEDRLAARRDQWLLAKKDLSTTVIDQRREILELRRRGEILSHTNQTLEARFRVSRHLPLTMADELERAARDFAYLSNSFTR